jgi:ribosomal protein S18 acetylase RimI-like enzyme
MTAVTEISHQQHNPQLRPLNPRRDLKRVADLIELCFSDSLDADGKRYLRRMRHDAKNRENRWFDTTAFQINNTAEGFVWEEDGQIAGNISLIPFLTLGNIIYLIANVAVHPEYRRRGIARTLTMAALDWTQKRRSRAVWLQVRDNNPPAINLYESVGFVEQARRTSWMLLPGNLKGQAVSGVRITSQKSRHWSDQREWLRLNYPDQLFWYWPLSPSVFQPGIWGILARFITDNRLRQWGVERQGQLLGTLSWRATATFADQLWLAALPENEDIVLQTLLPYIHWRERARRPLSIDYPVGRAVNTLHDSGFRPNHTLIWMELNF